MEKLQQLEENIIQNFLLSLDISYTFFIIFLLIISFLLLLSDIKFLLIKILPTLAPIIDSNDYINMSINYKYCYNNVYQISSLHKLRISLTCVVNEIKNYKSFIVPSDLNNIEKKLNSDQMSQLNKYKINKFYDPITNQNIYLYSENRLINIYDNYKFDHAINYISIFYNRFSKLDNKINTAIVDRINMEFYENNLNLDILKRIYLFWNICNRNKDNLYLLSEKKLINKEINILYKFIKDNIIL